LEEKEKGAGDGRIIATGQSRYRFEVGTDHNGAAHA